MARKKYKTEFDRINAEQVEFFGIINNKSDSEMTAEEKDFFRSMFSPLSVDPAFDAMDLITCIEEKNLDQITVYLDHIVNEVKVVPHPSYYVKLDGSRNNSVLLGYINRK